MRTLCPYITFHSFLVPHLCVPKIVVSFHLSRAMSLAPHRTPSTSSSTFSSVPGLQRLLTSRIPALIHENAGVTDILVQNLSQVVSPTSLLNRRAEDHQITAIVGHVKTFFLSTSHCCLPPKIPLKALLRLKKQTWTTNKFVLCGFTTVLTGARSKCATIARISL